MSLNQRVTAEFSTCTPSAELPRLFPPNISTRGSPPDLVEDAGIRCPHAFVSPRTAFTAAVRNRTRSSRARIRVRASCCSTVRY
jgi:hypothetical protein